MNKVLLALSGGVDSSVSAELLKRSGYKVSGLVMMMSDAHKSTVFAAKEAAASLEIELYVLDLRSEFKRIVIDYFANEYLNGRTPSPCVVCNPKVKFKHLLKFADENGFDYIATGHYANITVNNDMYLLKKAGSDKRDQSYMLAGLGQDVLSRLIMPLGQMDKNSVRQIAADIGLRCKDAPDSQENCFIPDNNYAEYISNNYSLPKCGDFLSPDGRVLGKNNGIIRYTIGQRKGLGISLGKPAYVSVIDSETGNVTLSYEKVQTDCIRLSNVSEVYKGSIKNDKDYFCKLRSTGKLLKCRTQLCQNNDLLLLLDSPTPKVSAGQAGVIYDRDFVVGMGIIENN